MMYNIDRESVVLTPAGEELIWITETQWSTIPMTCGLEIEQLDSDMERCSKIFDRYEWHYDLSGPYETALEPSITPLTKIKEFINLVLEDGCAWEWKGFYYRYRDCGPCGSSHCEIGCGSHIHLRPRPSELHKENPRYRDFPGIDKDPPYPHPETVTLEDVWATTYNTLIEVYPFIIPLFVHGNREAPIYKPRPSITRWAEFNHRRESPEGFFNRYMRPDYYDHPYDAVALNRKTESKPLTLELRMNEAHPSVAYFTIIILNRIVRKVYARGYLSPKIELSASERSEFYETIRMGLENSAINCEGPLYDTLENAFQEWVREHGPLRFEQGREIPGCKREYDSYFKLFKDILYANSNWLNPVEERIYRLFTMKGNPAKNGDKLWNIFRIPKGEFCWNDPEWCEKG